MYGSGRGDRQDTRPATAGRDGLPAIRTLTRRPPDAAVSVVTDRADEETPSYALTYGAAASLPKRVGAGDLRDVLRRVARAESPSSMIACSRHRSWPRMRAVPRPAARRRAGGRVPLIDDEGI